MAGKFSSCSWYRLRLVGGWDGGSKVWWLGWGWLRGSAGAFGCSPTHGVSSMAVSGRGLGAWLRRAVPAPEGLGVDIARTVLCPSLLLCPLSAFHPSPSCPPGWLLRASAAVSNAGQCDQGLTFVLLLGGLQTRCPGWQQSRRRPLMAKCAPPRTSKEGAR